MSRVPLIELSFNEEVTVFTEKFWFVVFVVVAFVVFFAKIIFMTF